MKHQQMADMTSNLAYIFREIKKLHQTLKSRGYDGTASSQTLVKEGSDIKRA